MLYADDLRETQKTYLENVEEEDTEEDRIYKFLGVIFTSE